MPTRIAGLILMLLFVSGCSKPIPQVRSNYIGYWQGENMELSISTGGMLAYRRFSKGMNTRINAPITEFKGDDFVVGLWFMTTRFVVSEPPHQVHGQWQMVVDGVRLKRSGPVPNSSPGSGRPKFSCSDCSPLRAA